MTAAPSTVPAADTSRRRLPLCPTTTRSVFAHVAEEVTGLLSEGIRGRVASVRGPDRQRRRPARHRSAPAAPSRPAAPGGSRPKSWALPAAKRCSPSSAKPPASPRRHRRVSLRPPARPGRLRPDGDACSTDRARRSIAVRPLNSTCATPSTTTPPHPCTAGQLPNHSASASARLMALLTAGGGQRLGIFAGTGRRQERPDGHDLPPHAGRRQRHRAGRRTRARGARVRREGARAGGSGPQRPGRLHIRHGPGPACAGLLPRHRHRRVLPRPGPQPSCS